MINCGKLLTNLGFTETSNRTHSLFRKKVPAYRYEANFNGAVYWLMFYEDKGEIIVLLSDLGGDYSPFEFKFDIADDALEMITEKIRKWASS